MRRLAAPLGLALAFALLAGSAKAAIVVTIDKSQQRMSVVVDGGVRHNRRVSTGRAGYGTPSGVYRPQHLAGRWYSRKHHHSPMPHAVFFHRGFAVHGSYEIAQLERGSGRSRAVSSTANPGPASEASRARPR